MKLSVSKASVACVNGEGVWRQKARGRRGRDACYKKRAFRLSLSNFDVIRFHKLPVTVNRFANQKLTSACRYNWLPVSRLYGRHGGQMVSPFASGSRGPGSSTERDIVLGKDTLLLQCLSQPRSTDKCVSANSILGVTITKLSLQFLRIFRCQGIQYCRNTLFSFP